MGLRASFLTEPSRPGSRPDYPESPRTVGEHLKKARFDWEGDTGAAPAEPPGVALRARGAVGAGPPVGPQPAKPPPGAGVRDWLDCSEREAYMCRIRNTEDLWNRIFGRSV
jgi:hypothetical protein